MTHTEYITGVLTKPDRITPSEETLWLRVMRGAEQPLKNGYFITKQDSREDQPPLSSREMQAVETAWLMNHQTWAQFRDRLGTRALTLYLNRKLTQMLNTQ